jgi:hypothetical protein
MVISEDALLAQDRPEAPAELAIAETEVWLVAVDLVDRFVDAVDQSVGIGSRGGRPNIQLCRADRLRGMKLGEITES